MRQKCLIVFGSGLLLIAVLELVTGELGEYRTADFFRRVSRAEQQSNHQTRALK